MIVLAWIGTFWVSLLILGLVIAMLDWILILLFYFGMIAFFAWSVETVLESFK